MTTLVAVWMILGKNFGPFQLALITSQDEQQVQPVNVRPIPQTEDGPVIDSSEMTIQQPPLKDSLPIPSFLWDNSIHLILLMSILVSSGIGCYFIKDLAPLCTVGIGILLLMMLDSIRFIRQLSSYLLPGFFVSLFAILVIAISGLMIIPEEESSPIVMNAILISSGIGFIILLMCSSMGFYCCSELNIQRSYFPKLMFSETEGYPNIFHSVLMVLLFSGCAILYTYVLFKLGYIPANAPFQGINPKTR